MRHLFAHGRRTAKSCERRRRIDAAGSSSAVVEDREELITDRRA
jgi:hypothetical protein